MSATLVTLGLFGNMVDFLPATLVTLVLFETMVDFLCATLVTLVLFGNLVDFLSATLEKCPDAVTKASSAKQSEQRAIIQGRKS